VTTKRSRATWHAVWNPRRRWWEIHNGRDVLAVVYGTKAEAVCMASAPRQYRALKALTRAKPGTQAHDAAQKSAQALVEELS
jgi:hypothetical protein